MLGRHWEPAPQLSQCSLWSMPGRFRLVRVQPSSVFRACRVPALVKPGALVAQSLSSSHNLRPDQCLRPHPEEDGLGFAKVGLDPWSTSVMVGSRNLRKFRWWGAPVTLTATHENDDPGSQP